MGGRPRCRAPACQGGVLASGWVEGDQGYRSGWGRMARKREEGLLDVFVEFPWWVSVCVGGVVFVAMRFVLPAIHFENAFLKAFALMAPSVAWIAVVFLVPAAVSALRSARTPKPAVSNGHRAAVSPLSSRSAPRTASRICERCGGEMVLRRARRGSNAGSDFWGCSNYPKCRHTEQLDEVARA